MGSTCRSLPLSNPLSSHKWTCSNESRAGAFCDSLGSLPGSPVGYFVLARATSNARIACKYVLFCYMQPALATGKTTFDSRWRYQQIVLLYWGLCDSRSRLATLVACLVATRNSKPRSDRAQWLLLPLPIAALASTLAELSVFSSPGFAAHELRTTSLQL